MGAATRVSISQRGAQPATTGVTPPRPRPGPAVSLPARVRRLRHAPTHAPWHQDPGRSHPSRSQLSENDLRLWRSSQFLGSMRDETRQEGSHALSLRVRDPRHKGAFEVVCEIEPATSPDLRRVRLQIGVLSAVSSVFLIPDNHIGRGTVSSIAVAREVIDMGGRAIACLNARNRNTLGFRRDLLTAAACGVDEFLFVCGDRPESGRRSDDLTVRTMLEEARRFEHHHQRTFWRRCAAPFWYRPGRGT